MCEEFNLTKEQKEKQKELFNGLYAMTLALSENIDDVVLNTKIYSVEDVLDENFWVDFTDDICEMNIIEYVKPVIKQVYNILNLYKKNPDYKNFKEDYWKKIYNYKEIDYNKPISYKTFKEVVASTPAFLNILYMHIDIAHSLKEIDQSINSSILPMAVDIKNLFACYFIFKIQYECSWALNVGTIKLLKDFPDLANGWAQCKSLADNYWLWIWLNLSLSVNCFESIYQIKLLSKDFIKNCEKEFWDGRLNDENLTQEENDKKDLIKNKKAHNAYDEWDNESWFKCRNIYNSSVNQYQLIKFLTTQLVEKSSYEIVMKDLGRIGMKNEDYYTNYEEIINQIYSSNQDCSKCVNKKGKACNKLEQVNTFDILNDIIKEKFELVYNKYFSNLKENSLQEVLKLVNNDSKQVFALYNVKKLFPFLEGKSDKTIRNKISDIEYQLKHNKFEGVNMDEHLNKVAELELIEQIKYHIQNLSNSLNMFLHQANECSFKNLIFNLVNLEELIKKSQAKKSA